MACRPDVALKTLGFPFQSGMLATSLHNRPLSLQRQGALYLLAPLPVCNRTQFGSGANKPMDPLSDSTRKRCKSGSTIFDFEKSPSVTIEVISIIMRRKSNTNRPLNFSQSDKSGKQTSSVDSTRDRYCHNAIPNTPTRNAGQTSVSYTHVSSAMKEP